MNMPIRTSLGVIRRSIEAANPPATSVNATVLPFGFHRARVADGSRKIDRKQPLLFRGLSLFDPIWIYCSPSGSERRQRLIGDRPIPQRLRGVAAEQVVRIPY